MRFVIAIVALVLAAAAIGLGVAQRTVLAGPASISSEVVTGDAPLTIIDGSTLNANAGTQAIRVAGTGGIMLAYGRTADVMAWVGDASYNKVTWEAEKQELTTSVVTGTEEEVPSPVGSDLWIREFTGTDVLTRKINAPEGISVIIAADPAADAADATTDAATTGDGAAVDDAAASDAAPSELSITWPLDNSAPFSGPLIVGGVILLLAGLGAFLWALVHARGRRGPRRSTPKLPKPPKPPRLKPQRGSETPAPELETRRSGRRRAFAAATGLAVSALVLTGCTTGAAQPEPTSSASAGITESPVAVTKGQFANILLEVASTVADADAAGDATLAATRVTGAALALRTANYAIRAADSSVAALPPIADDTIAVTLPQQTDAWPRSVFAVAKDAGGGAMGLMLTQQSPRENYKLAYAVTLISSVPDVAPAEIGAPGLFPDNTLGVLAPDELASAYGDILINGDGSDSFDLFQADGDSLRTEIGQDFKAKRASELPSSARIDFSNGPSDDDPIAFGTNDSGEIVALGLDDVETVTPVEAGAAVNTTGQVKALSGKGQSTRGFVATYGVQLLFYVPPAGSDREIVLLGYAQGLVSVTEVG